MAGIGIVREAGNRAGALAVLHLVPLLLTNRAAVAADLLGISTQTYMRMHASFGLMLSILEILASSMDS